jgi:hypothetical protein
MHINIELFVLLKCEYLNFKLQFQNPLSLRSLSQGLEVNINYMPP